VAQTKQTDRFLMTKMMAPEQNAGQQKAALSAALDWMS
jgi:hypothetical protein